MNNMLILKFFYLFYLFISIQPAIHVTSDTSKYNIGQHTVLSH